LLLACRAEARRGGRQTGCWLGSAGLPSRRSPRRASDRVLAGERWLAEPMLAEESVSVPKASEGW